MRASMVLPRGRHMGPSRAAVSCQFSKLPLPVSLLLQHHVEKERPAPANAEVDKYDALLQRAELITFGSSSMRENTGGQRCRLVDAERMLRMCIQVRRHEWDLGPEKCITQGVLIASVAQEVSSGTEGRGCHLVPADQVVDWSRPTILCCNGSGCHTRRPPAAGQSIRGRFGLGPTSLSCVVCLALVPACLFLQERPSHLHPHVVLLRNLMRQSGGREQDVPGLAMQTLHSSGEGWCCVSGAPCHCMCVSWWGAGQAGRPA